MTSCGGVEDCPLPKGEAEARYVQAVTTAEQIAQEGGNVPGWVSQLVERILATPTLPWRMVLRQFLTKTAHERMTYTRPSRRFAWMRAPIMPSRGNKTLGKVGLLIDTSGSMSDDVLDVILSELKSLLQQFPDSEVIVIQFDTEIHSTEHYGLGKALNIKKWKWKGRGGTVYGPAMSRLDKLGADAIIVATDGYPNGYIWPDKRTVKAPVLWAMTTDVQAPWGKTIRVKV